MTTGMVERAVLNDAEADALRVLANIYIGTPDCHIRREDANALINYMSRLENERSELRSALTASEKRAEVWQRRYRILETMRCKVAGAVVECNREQERDADKEDSRGIY